MGSVRILTTQPGDLPWIPPGSSLPSLGISHGFRADPHRPAGNLPWIPCGSSPPGRGSSMDSVRILIIRPRRCFPDPQRPLSRMSVRPFPESRPVLCSPRPEFLPPPSPRFIRRSLPGPSQDVFLVVLPLRGIFPAAGVSGEVPPAPLQGIFLTPASPRDYQPRRNHTRPIRGSH